jgi:hypothetical protein
VDLGFALLKEDAAPVSPTTLIHFEYYHDLTDLDQKFALHRSKTQCVVSSGGWFEEGVPFGKAQFPELSDYADGVDTMKFLASV